MSNNLDRFKNDLAKLISLGKEMKFDLAYRGLERQKKEALDKELREYGDKIHGSFEKNYQRWFTEACAVLKQLVPDRLPEFIQLYQGDGKRKEINVNTYRIQDWLRGMRVEEGLSLRGRFNDFNATQMLFQTELEILQSVQCRFESSLFDMAQLVRADLFDSELDAARELAKNGFLRGAGAVAGVVVEKHLAQVCLNHNVPVRKQHPTISEFNDLLKTAGVLDVPAWRQVQRLGDIRNLCDHNAKREPTAGEVDELIDGTGKLCKTLF